MGRIEGRVTNFMAGGLTPVAGVRVSVANGPAAESDANGRFVLDDVPVGDNVRVDISKATDPQTNIVYSSQQAILRVRDGRTTQIIAQLLTGCASSKDFGPSPTSVDIGEACPDRTGVHSNVEVPGDGTTTSTGAPYTGKVRVELVPIAFPPTGNGGKDKSWLSTLPGDGRGILTNGAPVELELVGGVEVRLIGTVDGKDVPVSLAPGKTAKVTIELADLPKTEDKQIPVHYDQARGIWVEEKAGAVVQKPGFVSFETQVSAAGWIGVAKQRPAKTTGCVAGRVSGVSDPTSANVSVVSSSSARLPGQSVMWADNGAFCANFNGAGVTNTIKAGPATSSVSTMQRAFAASVGHSCQPLNGEGDPGCFDVGELTVTDAIPVEKCVSATFSPTPGMEVDVLVRWNPPPGYGYANELLVWHVKPGPAAQFRLPAYATEVNIRGCGAEMGYKPLNAGPACQDLGVLTVAQLCPETKPQPDSGPDADAYGGPIDAGYDSGYDSGDAYGGDAGYWDVFVNDANDNVADAFADAF